MTLKILVAGKTEIGHQRCVLWAADNIGVISQFDHYRTNLLFVR